MKLILRKCTACLVTLAMLITLLPISALPVFAEGETVDLEISSLSDLETFRDNVNSGESYASKYIKLTADIDMSEKYGEGKESWTPIGYYVSSSESMLFKGTFDGDGHKISGLYIYTGTQRESNQGLFGYVGSGGTVKNLNVSGYVVAYGNVGIVAGYNSGTIKNVSADNYSFASYDTAGGIVGYNKGTVENATYSGTVEAKENTAGGIVGQNSGGTITKCKNHSTVSKSWEAYYIGGICGYHEAGAKISECYNDGAIYGSKYVGGIVGQTPGGEIADCYNLGAVSATLEKSGGICGEMTNSGKLSNVYNYGRVTAPKSSGAIYGKITYYNNSSEWKVTNAYYLDKTAPSDGTVTSCTHLSEADFAEESKLTGFDFDSIWIMDQDANRPMLRNVIEPKGTENNPILIKTIDELETFRDNVNGGETYEGKYLRLASDIDMSEKYGEGKESWTPIGASVNSNKGKEFLGTFSGGGHTISGLYITSNGWYQGLFGYVGKSGTIKNLTVSGEISGNADYVGLAAGMNYGTIANVRASGNVSGFQYVGLIAGANGKQNGSNPKIENSYADGSVTGQRYVGMIAGLNNGTISKCASSGEFSALENNSSDLYFGGICGYNEEQGKVEYCYNTAEFIDTTNNAKTCVGGICGWNESGKISDCYNIAPLSGYKVGGITSTNRYGTITGCYQYASVSGGEYTYPISEKWGGTVTNSYYNSDLFKSSGSYEGTALTAAQFAKQSSFAAGWDFTNVWMFDENAPRPVLKNNVEEIGTKTNPYMIKTAEQLKEFCDRVNGGETFEGKFVALGNDIDISAETNWTCIGDYSNQFKGSFDGQGYEISGLTVNSNSGFNQYAGLFGYIADGAAVKNLTVSGTVTSNAMRTGGVAGMNYGTIENVVNKVKVEQMDSGDAGGIAATNEGKIINCTNEANITGNAATVGGIAGYHASDGSIEYCKNTGNIETTNSSGYVGGIVGMNLAYATVNDVYSTGTVSGRVDISSATTLGGIVGYISGAGAKLSNGYYDSDKFDGNVYGDLVVFTGKETENVGGKPTAAFASGEVAHLLQSVHGDELVWGQNLSGTIATLPEHTGDITKKVLKLTLMKVDSTAESGYSEFDALYANYDQTISLAGHDAPNTETQFFLWWRRGQEGGTYTFKYEDHDEDDTLYPEMVDYLTFTVTGTNQVYKAGTPRTVKVQSNYGAPHLKVSYYEVDENSGKLKSTTPVANAISSGKYLYVISLDEAIMTESEKNEYRIKRAFNVENTDLPNADAYDNIGYMYISATAEQQSPIYFTDSVVNVYRTDSVSNPLEGAGNNPGATVTYESRNTSVAEVDNSGNVTLKGAGTAVIIATSKKEGCADVYASYTLNVTKEAVTVTAKDITMNYGDSFTGKGYILSKDIAADITGDAVYTTSYRTGDGIGKYDINISGLSSELYELVFVPGKLTVAQKALKADDFMISAKDKTYDGTANAELVITAKDGTIVSGDAVSLIASGTFNNANAGENKAVSYSATGLSGANSANYKIEGDGFSGNTSANIAQAEVTVSVPSVTTNVYDGEPKSVNAFAYANGRYFDKFDITYGGEDTVPSSVGEYDIGIEITDVNYKLADAVSAKLIIRSAQQDFFSIEGVPQSVVYGDTFTLQTAGTDGAVAYEITDGADLVTLENGVITAKGVGTVTVKATSKKGNFADKTAQKTFVIGKRTITATVSAPNRTYDGTALIDANIDLIGIAWDDKVDAKYMSAYTLTPDAELGKTVFVTGIYLDGEDSGKYQLLSSSAQTSIDINKKEITAAEITAYDKVYDKNTNAAYTVTNLDGIVSVDKDFVTLSGTAEFEDANAGEGKTVTLTNYSLTGTKSANYVLASDFADPQATAKIEQATVDFTVGTLEYVYDGKAKSVPITASVNGVPFTDFNVTYNGSETAPKDKADYAVAIILDDSTNYKTDFGGATLKILTADQNNISITGLVGTIDYGKVFSLSAQGGSGTGAVVWQSSNEDMAKVNDAGVVEILGTGEEVTITATKAADGNYGAQSASVTFTPVKKAVSFKLSNLNHTYSGQAKSAVVTGVDSYTLSYTDENGADVIAPTKAGTYYVSVSATGNYDGSVSGVMTIKNADIAANGITFDVCDTTYGTPISVTMPDSSSYPAGVSAKVTYTGSGIYEPTEDMPTNAGKYMATLTLSGENYNETKLTRGFVIEKAVLTAKPKAATRKYGEPNPIFEIEYFDQNNNAVDKSNITIEPTAYTEANISTETGAYDIIASGGYAENYTFSYETGTLTIGEATGGSFHIMGGQTNPYVGAAFTLSAYYNNEKAEVSWSSSNSAVATVDAGGAVTVHKDGTATITAKMTDSRFDKNLTAEFALTAQYAPETQQQIYFEEPLVEKYVTDGQFTAVLSGLSDGASVKYKSSKPDVAAVDEASGKITVKKIGTTVITATATKFNCPDVQATYTLTVKKYPVMIKADDISLTYGDEFVSTTVTYSDGLSVKDFGGTLGFTTRYAAGKSAGEYDVTPNGLTSDIYDITFESGTITVSEKILSADDFEVSAQDKTYDETTSADVNVAVKANSLVGADRIAAVVSGAFDDENAGENKTVSYTISDISGRGFENYKLDGGAISGTTTADITKAKVTFFVSERTVRNYDGNAKKVEISAMALGNVFRESGYTVYYEKDGAKITEPTETGEYTVLVELADEYGANFEAVQPNAVLVIETDTAAELRITGSGKNVTVGDVFTLYAQYGNNNPNVIWESSDADVAEISDSGEVKILKSGSATITATLDDSNYGTGSATFDLEVSKKQITLKIPASELVKTYNGQRQDIAFANVPNGADVTASYVKIDDSSVTEPKNAGTYSVSYEIIDDRYEASGNTTLTINKAKVTVKAKDIQKTYGSEPNYELEVISGSEIANADDFADIAEFASDGADKSAKVGEYDITLNLTSNGDENRIFEVGTSKGKLSVVKSPLTIKVKDVTREYGAENPTLEAEFTGFVNGETKDVLTGELSLSYDENINTETAVGTHTGVTTASGLMSDNYDITYEKGNVEVTKIKVTASAGTSRSSYLTVNLDKPIAGLTADNFEVKNGESIVDLTSVTASSDNKTYTLNGSFTTGTAYTVTPKITSETHEIISEPLTITPSRSSSGGSGGGGGSATPTTYTVSFETNGGSKVASAKVKKNELAKEPTAPEKDGFEFAGWYSDKDLTEEYDFSAKVTKNITLYAKWSEKQTTDPTEPSGTKWENPFTDVREGDWFYNNVKFAVQNKLFGGTTATTFEPNTPITRGMVVTVLYRAEDEPEVNKSIPFADITASDYFANAVIWAQQNGIVTGTSETAFAPNDNITREQLAAIILRFAMYKGYDVSAGDNTNILSYDDFGDISEYAIPAMQYAAGAGLINGKSAATLNPKDGATRAEAAAILQRFIEANR